MEKLVEADKRVEARNISMYPDDWQTVQGVADNVGLSVSAAMRVIIKEWQEAKKRLLTV